MEPLESAWTHETLEQSYTENTQAQALRLTILFHPQWERVGDWTEWILPPVTPSDPPPQRLAQYQITRQQPLFNSVYQAPARDLADPYISRRGISFDVHVDGSVIFHRDQCPHPIHINHDQLTQELRLDRAALDHGIVFSIAQRVVLHLKRYSVSLPQQSYTGPSYGMVGFGIEMDQVRTGIQRLAGLDIPVLIRGESGTGKELVARALHEASRRQQQKFVAINAAAIPATLAAAEIFGATRGAFTGSHQNRQGYLAQASGGSLFLDEIGDLPAEIQVMLLRVLETNEYQALGSNETQTFTARLIAATDVDLENAIEREHFRSSLYHRLSASEIRLPALREQIQNLGLLLKHCLQQECAELGLNTQCLESRPATQASWLPAQWVHRLALADWPGNIRQLRNVARQLLLIGHRQEQAEHDPQMHAVIDQACQSAHASLPHSHNPNNPTTSSDPSSTAKAASVNAAQQLRELDDEALLGTLIQYHWRIQRAAKALGVPRSSLYDRIHRSPTLSQALAQHRQQ